jgi:arylsulfatase A-like enzyme
MNNLPTDLPNIVLIMTDQHRADYLGCYGHPVLKTPHIDSLAAKGTRFENCYVASPVCMPNRASLMTGRMPSAHRVRMNGIPLSLQENTFVELLRVRGYQTALIGKSHLQNMVDIKPFVQTQTVAQQSGKNYWYPPEGWTEAFREVESADYGQELPARWNSNAPMEIKTPFYGFAEVDLCTGHGDLAGGHYYQWLRDEHPEVLALRGPENSLAHSYIVPQAWRTSVPEAFYPTQYIALRSEAFIRKCASGNGNTPFFLSVSFPDPHHPFTPPGRYWDMYHPDEQVLPASFWCESQVLPQVGWARRQRSTEADTETGYGAFAISEREAREAMALTCGMIAMIDDSVGQILEALQHSGLSEKTILVFTSDHGDFLGDHGLLLKGPVHLQSLLKVPLIWSDPTMPQDSKISTSLVSSIDISASLLDRVGIAPYNGLQGKSFLSSINDCQAGGNSVRESTLIQEDAQQAWLGFDQAPRIRTLISKGHRLSVYGRTGHGELFDLVNDPDELINEWNSPSHRSIQSELMQELALSEMDAMDDSPLPSYLA